MKMLGSTVPVWFNVYTLRPTQNCRHFPDDIFKFIFVKENVHISIKVLLKFVPNTPIIDIPALVEIISWHRPGNKPLSEIMMVWYWCIYGHSVSYNGIPIYISTSLDYIFFVCLLKRESTLYTNTESTGPFHNMAKLKPGTIF